jgi:thioredoxin-related protein
MSKFIACLFCLIAPAVVCAAAEHAARFNYESEYETATERETIITTSSDLQQAAALARSRGVPLLLEFSTPWCSYCVSLEENVLEPLLRSQDYGQHMVLRKLEITDYTRIRDFDGHMLRSDALARNYRVDLYPTLLLFDTRGREVVRIVGITMLEYVSQQLEAALLAQRAPAVD